MPKTRSLLQTVARNFSKGSAKLLGEQEYEGAMESVLEAMAISQDNGLDPLEAEALSLLKQVIEICTTDPYYNLLAEAYLEQGQVYTNINRWNDRIDPTI